MPRGFCGNPFILIGQLMTVFSACQLHYIFMSVYVGFTLQWREALYETREGLSQL